MFSWFVHELSISVHTFALWKRKITLRFPDFCTLREREHFEVSTVFGTLREREHFEVSTVFGTLREREREHFEAFTFRLISLLNHGSIVCSFMCCEFCLDKLTHDSHFHIFIGIHNSDHVFNHFTVHTDKTVHIHFTIFQPLHFSTTFMIHTSNSDCKTSHHRHGWI